MQVPENIVQRSDVPHGVCTDADGGLDAVANWLAAAGHVPHCQHVVSTADPEGYAAAILFPKGLVAWYSRAAERRFTIAAIGVSAEAAAERLLVGG